MDDFRIAVKAFILNSNDELLVVKRRDGDVHKPGKWDVPGGRLVLGEDPFVGLLREVFEETGLVDVSIGRPLGVHHFIRDDGQKITMIIFECRSNGVVKLSEEHTEFAFVKLVDAKTKLGSEFYSEVDLLIK